MIFWRMFGYKIGKYFEFTCKLFYCINVWSKISKKEFSKNDHQIGVKFSEKIKNKNKNTEMDQKHQCHKHKGSL